MINWLKKRKQLNKIKGNLVFAFKDDDGHSYYRFPSPELIGLNRLFKIQDFMTWMVRGLTQDNVKEIADRIEDLAMDGITKGKNGAKIVVLAHELKDRNERCVPVEIVYNYLACFYVREDENPDIVNEQVQKEKVVAFKKSAESGNADGFFFALPEYKRICELLSTTNNSWESIVQESVEQMERMRRLMKTTTSES